MRRFEKSLYDLIRGLRNHKGNEKEYIQKSLKECRAEVRSQDMGEYQTFRYPRMDKLTSSTSRRQGDGAPKAHLPRDARPRHVLGFLPRP